MMTPEAIQITLTVALAFITIANGWLMKIAKKSAQRTDNLERRLIAIEKSYVDESAVRRIIADKIDPIDRTLDNLVHKIDSTNDLIIKFIMEQK